VTSGSAKQVFALASLLSFRFAPRMSDALSKILYLLDQANMKLMSEQWDEMRRVASFIRHGTVSASLLMRKLAAHPRHNQVVRSLTEMGKLERTAFLLEYFCDAVLRRRILIGLELWGSIACACSPALLWSPVGVV